MNAVKINGKKHIETPIKIISRQYMRCETTQWTTETNILREMQFYSSYFRLFQCFVMNRVEELCFIGNFLWIFIWTWWILTWCSIWIETVFSFFDRSESNWNSNNFDLMIKPIIFTFSINPWCMHLDSTQYSLINWNNFLSVYYSLKINMENSINNAYNICLCIVRLIWNTDKWNWYQA